MCLKKKERRKRRKREQIEMNKFIYSFLD